MKRFILSLALIIALSTIALGAPQQLPDYPIVIGDAPVIVVPPMGLDATCATCYQPGKYYSGGLPARFVIEVHPWYRITAPDFVVYDDAESDDVHKVFHTKCNDAEWRDGVLSLATAKILVQQETTGLCPEGSK